MVSSATSATYGAMSAMLTLSDALENRGHTVEFATWEGRGFTDEMRRRGKTVHAVRVRAKIDPIAVGSLARIIRKRKIDIVHTHLSTSSIIGCLAGRVARVPAVATVHGLSGKLSFVFANHLTAVSQATKEHMVAQGVPASRITVVYNGILPRSNAPTRDEAQHALGVIGHYPVLATTARILRSKGAHVAIQAVALLSREFPELRYLMVGDGADTREMQALAHSLGVQDKVEFTGFVTDVWQILPALDAFVFPSLKEAMGISIVEAMSMGLPIVASNVGGIPEVLDDSCGRLVPAEDAAALAAGIRSALKHPEIGEIARTRMLERFSDVAMATATEAVYRRLLGAT